MLTSPVMPLIALTLGAATEVPRYEVAAGQEIVYETVSRTRRGESTTTTKGTWQFRVLADRDADGAWPLAFRHSLVVEPEGPAVMRREPRVFWGACKLYPDGRLVVDQRRLVLESPSPLFVRLPETMEAAKAGWRYAEHDTPTRHDCTWKPEAEPAGVWTIEAEAGGNLHTVHERTEQVVFHFASDRGLTTRIERTSTRAYGRPSTTTRTVTLKGVTPHDADQTAAFATQFEAFWQALVRAEDLTDRAGKDPEQTDALLTEAKDLLKRVREEVKLETMRAYLDHQTNQLELMASYLRRSARQVAGVVGKPSQAWETTDIDGQPWALKELRGQVVVLEFWFRGCPWCIRTMPQTIRLAERFKDRPVQVLAMNVDRNVEDARFVAEKMELPYPVLKAREVARDYGLSGMPTHIVIDPAGVVRHMHVGYSPTLAEELGAKIEAILKEAKETGEETTTTQRERMRSGECGVRNDPTPASSYSAFRIPHSAFFSPASCRRAVVVSF